MATKQYYKVIDTVGGHYGFMYKKGINTDPHPIHPIEKVGSCSKGALYFTDKEHLDDWLSAGDSIAWVTPVSKVVADSSRGKWKAHTLRITRILPIYKALPIIMGMEQSAFNMLDGAWDAHDWKECRNILLENCKNKRFVKKVNNKGFVYDNADLSFLIKHKLYMYLTPSAVSDLISGMEIKRTQWPIIMKIISKDPKRYLEAI